MLHRCSRQLQRRDDNLDAQPVRQSWTTLYARLTTGPKTFPAAFYFRIVYPPVAIAIANLIFSPFLLHHPALPLPLSPSSPHPRASGPSLTFR